MCHCPVGDYSGMIDQAVRVIGKVCFASSQNVTKWIAEIRSSAAARHTAVAYLSSIAM